MSNITIPTAFWRYLFLVAAAAAAFALVAARAAVCADGPSATGAAASQAGAQSAQPTAAAQATAPLKQAPAVPTQTAQQGAPQQAALSSANAPGAAPASGEAPATLVAGGQPPPGAPAAQAENFWAQPIKVNLTAAVNAAKKKDELRASADGQTTLQVLPGGDKTTVVLPEAAGQHYFYARLVDAKNAEREVKVLSVTPKKTAQNEEPGTELTLGVPDLGFGWQRRMNLVLLSFPLKDGKPLLNAPDVSAVQPVKVSDWRLPFLAALAAVFLVYLAAVLAVGRIKQHYTWNPVYITSGTYDTASLSQFQIFFFTLLIFGILVYILFRMDILPNISSDILLLLGISAVGTVGSKVANVMKKRLSSDNWAWLRNNGWLTVYEVGLGGLEPDTKRARWGDLLKTDCSFNIYSFQLVTFSGLVGYALLTSDLKALATFSIPQNLLALLGLSNAVYIGGKAVGPGTIGELDDKLVNVRAAETAWITAATPSQDPMADQDTKRKQARTTKAQEATTYLAGALEAARILKSVYGAEGTKFKKEPITEDQVMPQFP